MTKVIGIISYLPEDSTIRKHRWEKLNKLIDSCNNLFDLPIIIIAQNWKNLIIEKKNVKIYFYDKLGIVGARKELRKKFLESSIDYLIMLDDDCQVTGASGKTYLNQIELYPDCFIEFNKTLLKLFAISRSLFKEVDYDDINPEAGEGFEDRIFVNKLRKKFPDKRKYFANTGISQHSISTNDADSTWYKDQDLSKMLEKTFKIIEEI